MTQTHTMKKKQQYKESTKTDSKLRKAKIEKLNKEREFNEEPVLLDYCCYTKEPIYDGDNHVFKDGKYFTINGFLQDNNIIEEINFEEA